MVTDAGTVLERHLQKNPHVRAEWHAHHKPKCDPRITAVGRFLRRTSLDELPQVWNVLRGGMSLIGPRPIVAAEIPDFGDAFELYKQVLPGITGLWQVSGRNDLTYDQRGAVRPLLHPQLVALAGRSYLGAHRHRRSAGARRVLRLGNDRPFFSNEISSGTLRRSAADRYSETRQTSGCCQAGCAGWRRLIP